MIGTSGQPHSHGVVDFPRPGMQGSLIALTLPARAENIAVVRQVLGAIAGVLRLAPGMLEDLRLAVTEACTNVVRHAYADGGGTMEVQVAPSDDGLEVVVTDHGRGMGPSPDTRGPGLGLPLIAALADSLHIDPGPGTGSRVAMSFARRRHEAAA